MSEKSKKLRFLSLFWDYVSALSLIALLFLLWNLGKGPIKVDFLRPYIEQALTSDNAEYDLGIGSVNVELVHSIQPVKIIAKDVEFKARKGDYLIKAPRLSLSFSARALLKGMLAPSTVRIEKPYITINASYGLKNEIEVSKSAEEKAQEIKDFEKRKELSLKKMKFYFTQFEEFMVRFNSAEKLYMESFINNIQIEDAVLEVNEVDVGSHFTFEDLDFKFDHGLTEILLSADSAVKFENRVAALDMAIRYQIRNDEIRYEMNFSDLVITDLYDLLIPVKGDLKVVDVPVNGHVSALIDFGNILKNKDNFENIIGENIKEVKFSVEGGSGKIGFANNDDFDYKMSSFELNGRLHGGLDNIKIDNAVFDFDGKKAILSLNASGLKDYLFKGHDDKFKINFRAKLGEFEMDELSLLWPKYLGHKAWAWCKDGLYGGNIANGDFSFDFGWDKKNKQFGLLKLTGTADIIDSNLYYLKGMPIIRNVYGTAQFEQNEISIKVDKGVSDGVILTGGTVLLYDLDKDDNFIRIDLTGNSTITDALKLIDNEPLGFTKEMGVDPNLVAGDVDVGLKLDFELKSNLNPKEIKVEVLGDLKQVEYLGLDKGHTFVADALKLLVTEKGFELSGVAKYQDVPLSLVLNENFADKKYKSRIVADMKVNDEILRKLNVKSEILAAPYFTGNSDVNAVLTFLDDGKIDLTVDANLKDTSIDYAFLGFAKEKGIPCRAKAKMLIDGNKLAEVSAFSLEKEQFSAKGKMKTDDKGRLQEIDISEIKAPKAFAKARVDFGYDPKLRLKVTVSGDSFDLTDFFDTKKKDTVEKTKVKNLKDPLEDVMDTDIVIGVNKLWTNDNVPVSNFAGRVQLRNGIGLHRVNMIGNYGNSRDVKMKLDFEPRGKDYILNVSSNNAGSTLKVLRLYDNMKGGNLEINAKRDKYKNFKGHAKMRDFSLINTPVFAKVLSVASLSGMVDMLTGEGLTFTHMNAPFSYTFSNKNLATEDFKMFGPVLGVTLRGKYNLFDEQINAKGMVIPAYGLNTMLGNIPFVGRILAGKDGTVFATNYNLTGSLAKPEITINPLSTLAPNSVKEFFESEE